MTAEERKKKRFDIDTEMLIMMQILSMWQTYGSFMDEFERRMKERIGEYTAEDEQWVYEQLQWFEKKNKE